VCTGFSFFFDTVLLRAFHLIDGRKRGVSVGGYIITTGYESLLGSCMHVLNTSQEGKAHA